MATPEQIKRNTQRVKANAPVAISGSRRQNLAQLAGQHFGGDRDLYQVMGYPRDLGPEDYFAVYMRQDLAGRIVDAYPDATWREAPEIEGSEEFRTAWNDLQGRLKIWRSLHRLDRLMNLGHYGVLLLGLDGGESPEQPVNPDLDYELLYVQPHSERTAMITHWEDNPQSPRFGLPKLYRITTGVNWTGSGAGQKTMTVHHSRVIHVAERALEDVSIGTPRLERGYNRLMDLDKLLGGSAEMYWQNVAMLLAFLADANVQWDEPERAAMAEQLEEMQNGLRRALRLRGVEVQNVAPGLQGASPGEHIDKQIEVLAGAYAIPKRILVGNEAGELASSQDENAWNGRIAERRDQLATPTFIEAFISAGQRLGFLPRGYAKTVWPESDSLGEQARAEIALKKAQAIQTYVNSMGSELLVSPEEFRRDVLELEGPLPRVDELPIDEDDPNLTDEPPTNV